MKAIFLDIDGVLNDANFLKPQHQGGIHTDGWKWLEMIDPTKVALLNQIIEATDAKVVISSSWRLANTIEQLEQYLDHHGFIGEIYGTTPCRLSNHYRGNEIKWYLQNHPEVSTFVILDDNSDMLELKMYLIQTSFEKLLGDDSGGLLDRHVKLAIKRLLGNK